MTAGIDREICEACVYRRECSLIPDDDFQPHRCPIYKDIYAIISRRIAEAEKRKDEECEKKCARAALEAVERVIVYPHRTGELLDELRRKAGK